MKYYAIEGRKNSLSIAIIVMVIVAINIITIISLLLPQPFDFLKEDVKVSCRGIGFFYSNTSFLRDYERMNLIHKTIPTMTDGNSIVSPPINMLFPFERYDCEDYAHAVSCLAKLYRQEVDYYNVHWKNLNKEEEGWHIGFCFDADGKRVCDD